MSEKPRGEGDRDTVGFQAARREVDNETPDLAGAAILETRRHEFDVRRWQEWGLRIEIAESAMDERDQVATHEGGIVAL